MRIPKRNADDEYDEARFFDRVASGSAEVERPMPDRSRPPPKADPLSRETRANEMAKPRSVSNDGNIPGVAAVPPSTLDTALDSRSSTRYPKGRVLEGEVVVPRSLEPAGDAPEALESIIEGRAERPMANVPPRSAINAKNVVHLIEVVGENNGPHMLESLRRILADNPALAFVRDDGLRTPLMHAMANRNAGAAALLLEAGANPRAVDLEGRSAADYAMGDPAMEGLLEMSMRGGRVPVPDEPTAGPGDEALEPGVEQAAAQPVGEARPEGATDGASSEERPVPSERDEACDAGDPRQGAVAQPVGEASSAVPAGQAAELAGTDSEQAAAAPADPADETLDVSILMDRYGPPPPIEGTPSSAPGAAASPPPSAPGGGTTFSGPVTMKPGLASTMLSGADTMFHRAKEAGAATVHRWREQRAVGIDNDVRLGIHAFADQLAEVRGRLRTGQPISDELSGSMASVADDLSKRMADSLRAAKRAGRDPAFLEEASRRYSSLFTDAKDDLEEFGEDGRWFSRMLGRVAERVVAAARRVLAGRRTSDGTPGSEADAEEPEAEPGSSPAAG